MGKESLFGTLGQLMMPMSDRLHLTKDLDHIAAYFVQEVCRADGNPYVPDSLRDLVSGIQRHAREELQMRDINLLAEQSLCKKALEARCRELTSKGCGVVKKQAQPITVDQEIKLWAEGLLGMDTSQ